MVPITLIHDTAELSASAVPFNFSPNPEGRGTFGIFTLCLGTLLICIWSVLHPDIPLEQPTLTGDLAYKLKWMAICLLAPELVLIKAMTERLRAFEVLRSLPEGNILRSSPAEITLVHAFYASMGGYVLDVSREGPLFLPSGKGRATLTPAGLRFVMGQEPDIVPNLSADDINNMTQASSLEKAVLVGQILLFCMSSLSRLAQQLPLSLLEVSTAAHGLCAIIIYLFWWEKPFNIRTPTLITGIEATELCALMVMLSPEEMFRTGELLDPTNWVDNGILTRDPDPRTELTVHALGRIPGLETQTDTPWYWAEEVENSERFERSFHASFLVRRMISAGKIWSHVLPNSPLLSPNLVTFTGSESFKTGYFAVWLSIFGVLYGLPHVAAWNITFPTEVERQLWHICSVIVSVMGILGALLIQGLRCVPDLPRIDHDRILWGVLGFVYIPASGFLLLESVRQLFYLPPQAYEVPSWTNYWPHFS